VSAGVGRTDDEDADVIEERVKIVWPRVRLIIVVVGAQIGSISQYYFFGRGFFFFYYIIFSSATAGRDETATYTL